MTSLPDKVSWSCATCPSPKPASWCSGCAREKGTATSPYHYVPTHIPEDADLIIVAEAPTIGRINDPSTIHVPFMDDSGKIINRAIETLKSKSGKYNNLKIGKTYAVLCTSNQGEPEPAKNVIDRCKTFLHTSLARFADKKKKPILLLMGMSAVKAVGMKAAKLRDIQSRLIANQPVNDQTFDVVVTISTKQLVAVPGLYTTFLTDLERALDASVLGAIPKTAPIEELTKDYIFPKTPEEVREVCELILRYSENNTPPDKWSIAVDTETNTKFPHRDSLRVLAVSFSWAAGKATAIGLWHPEVKYDPRTVTPYIAAVLASGKPKILHNAKFDLKVFMKLGWELNQFAWDTMTGEHAIEEDKKGQYGLKPLTRSLFPEFASYADTLQEMLSKEEGDSQLDNIRKKQKVETLSEKELLEGKKKSKNAERLKDGGFEKIPLDTLLKYAAIDTDMTRRLALVQRNRIISEQNEAAAKLSRQENSRTREYPVPRLCKTAKPVWHLALNTVFPVTPTIARMEFQGIRVDRPYLEKLQNDLNTVVLDAESELYKMAGSAIKLNSGAAVANVLFDSGFIHPVTGDRVHYSTDDNIGKTQKGAIQTTEKVMQYLVAKYQCPFASKKLIYSKAFKAKNTFCANVWDLSELDGFLHTNYNQHGTSSGRLSSNDENMQNIPKKLAGVNIKKIFVPTDDSMLFVNADAKGAEVRILTAYCQDKGLIDSLNAGQDTHCFIASQIIELVRKSPNADEALESMRLAPEYPYTYEDFASRDKLKQTNKPYAEMLDKFRTAVKRVVFGILYGAGPQKIAETIGISVQQAQDLISNLFRMFPSIQTYMAQTKWELKTFGYVETYFGRRRRFNVAGAPRYLQGRAERQTVNFKIQSTSSDIVLGRLQALEGPLTRDMGGRLLLTVHDSIGFEVPKKYAHQLPDFIYEHLEKGAATQHPWLPVAFKWDYEVGPSYGELKALDAYLANTLKEETNTDAAEAYTEEEVRTALSEE